MSMDCRPLSVKRFKALFILLIVFFVPVFAASSFAGMETPVVILDPGHGGRDFGVKGPDGTLEKTLSLKLARIISSDIENGWRTILTRNDDFNVASLERTSTANHHRADAFISLHMGGTFVRHADNILIYYFEKSSGQSLSNNNLPYDRSESNNTRHNWDEIQGRIKPSSRTLAGYVRNRLVKFKHFDKIEIRGAPILALRGASMPAILIEAGYLSNPVREKKYNSERYLPELADGIRSGIEDFLKSRDGN